MKTMKLIAATAVAASSLALVACAGLSSNRGPAPISQYHQESPEWEIRQVPPGARRYDVSGSGEEVLSKDGVAMPDATALPVRRR